MKHQLATFGITGVLACIGLALAFPTIFVLFKAFIGSIAASGDTAAPSVVRYILTTLSLLGIVGVSTLILGVAPAWLITTKDFPLRRLLSWALVLPLAVPSYIMAYVYVEIFDASGPVFSLDWVKAEISRPDIFSIWGLAWVMSISLFPYVYLAARAGFSFRNQNEIRAAKSLGASEWRVFRQVIMPSARPALAAGLALVLMETMADFGAADFLQVNTLTIAIFRAWHSYSDINHAANLSVWLMLMAAFFVFIERSARKAYRAGSTSTSAPDLGRSSRVQAWIITAFLSLIFIVGFLVPIIVLVISAFQTGALQLPLWQATKATFLLGLLGAGTTVIVGVIVGLSGQFPLSQGVIRLISMLNYAQAGPILALGAVLGLIAVLGGISPAVSIFALTWVYVCRFANSAIEQIIAGTDRIPRKIHYAAKSLGSDGLRKISRVDLPLLLPAILTGGLIVGIEIIKELPATLILRPFGWDTLALQAHFYAKDEALSVAALPALLICALGTLPIFLISRRLK